MTTKKKSLSSKQLKFCQEYVKHRNASAAAAAAGYSQKNSKESGHSLLTNTHIRKEIQRMMDRYSAKTDITVERLLKELALVAYSDPNNVGIDKDGKVIPLNDAPPDVTRTVSSVKRKFKKNPKTGEMECVDAELKFWSKDRAMENLGKHLQIFVERHRVEGHDGKAIEITHGLSDDVADQIRSKILGLNSKENK